MSPVQTLAAILGLSTVSGVNLYLTVLLVGLGQRFGWIHGLPQDLAVLSHPLVLGAAAFMYLMEFVADKVPFVTPIWDGFHTFIRPVGGALLALGAAADLHPVAKVLAVLAGGTIALGAHGSKMGLRLLAHTTPEPASHSTLSLLEDVGVVALLALAYQHPAIAIPVLGVLILATAFLLPLVVRILVFVLLGCRGALRSLFGQASQAEIPDWVDLKALELAPDGATRALACFARKVKGLPRLQAVYLVQAGGNWHLLYRRWFRARSLSFDPGPGATRAYRGFLWDTLVFSCGRKPQVLLVSRDWRPDLPVPSAGPPN
jgi:hypothetical protein